MADNIIKRIIQLVLDKESAKKTQDDANSVAEGIDKAWKSAAAKIAGYLGAAFLIDKIVGLGKASVREAAASEAAWRELKNTIDNAGESFDGLEAKIRATADAFQDGTIHDDDAFAKELSHIISLTGDVSASLNNMGLVADVAAKFFNGDLAAGGTMVAKVMNGNIAALNKMGIHVKDAQQGLEVLAQRSFGAAASEAASFDGQLKQMNNTWDDILKDLGNAIIQSDGATDAFSVLKAALKVLGEWVQNNQKAITSWVTNGVKFAIDAADIFIRAVMGMASILSGGFMSAIGLASVGIGKLIQAWGALREVEDNIREKLGQDVKQRREATKAIKDQAQALIDWGKEKFNAGADKITAGIDRLSTRMFSSDQFSGGKSGPLVKPPEKVKPMLGKNAVSDSSEEVRKAIEQFNKDALAAANMQKILGKNFDATAADIDRTTKLLNALASNGIEPATVGFAGLGDHLNTLTTQTKPLEEANKALAKSLATDVALGAIQAGSAMDQLKKQQDDVLASIKTLIDAGFDPQSKVIKDLTERYNGLTAAIDDASKIQGLAEVYKALGDEIRGNLFMATLDGATSIDRMRIEQQALQKAIESMIAKGIKPEDKALQELQARYKHVTEAIKEQTTVMQLQAAAADFLADALGTAMQGGLHEAAVQKAKQNAIEAAEMLVRAGAFALFGDFPQASAALVLAGQFAGLAAAWGVLAAGSHGSSSGGAGAAIPSAGGAGSTAGTDLSSSRTASSESASRSEQPSAEVSIYLVGPGFHAMNPAVQRVVWGAQQQAAELYGPNARIRVRSSENGG